MPTTDRDFYETPYSPEEKRVAEYLAQSAGIGGGNDPIGFLLASHQELVRRMGRVRKLMSMEEFHKICFDDEELKL